MKKLCIVIPCYNEERGLPLQEYGDFIKRNPEVLLCFVNDGSKDRTIEVLEGIKSEFQKQVAVLSYEKNRGKAEAVRRGVMYCNENYDYCHVAFLDADLSTSLQECMTTAIYLKDNIEFAFGSRIMKIGSNIVRKQHRFIFGRFIATIISWRLGLKVYDTQCGCKIFTRQLAELIFEKPFISRWLFDVEIFQRSIILYGREGVLEKMIEVPLAQWIDRGYSKVKPTYFFRLWYDLYKIDKKYRSIKETVISTPLMIPKDA